MNLKSACPIMPLETRLTQEMQSVTALECGAKNSSTLMCLLLSFCLQITAPTRAYMSFCGWHWCVPFPTSNAQPMRGDTCGWHLRERKDTCGWPFSGRMKETRHGLEGRVRLRFSDFPMKKSNWRPTMAKEFVTASNNWPAKLYTLIICMPDLLCRRPSTYSDSFNLSTCQTARSFSHN